MDGVGEHRQGPETERLVMRAFDVDDGEAFFRLNSHPEVMRYTGEPPCVSVSAARAAIAAYPDWERHGHGRWATVYRPTGEVIGFAGLKVLEDLGEVDLGYRFLPAYWGRGLATEASRACLHYAFEVLGLTRVVGLADPANVASLRVLEKVGMVRQAPIDYEGAPTEYWRLTDARYRALVEATGGA